MARPAARTRQSGAATLTFLGAAGEVTGSCYLVESGEPFAARALRDEIRRKGWSAQVPSLAQTIEIA